jgi:perosamine synthetase
MKVPLGRPIITRKMIEAAAWALENERLVLGESVFKFEEEFADYCGTKYAVSTSSGTDALIIALRALGVEKRDVVTTPFTFIASSNAIIYAFGRPIFADIEDRTCNIDPALMRDRITQDTKVLMPVHLFGNPCDMDKIFGLTEGREDLLILEDACQAHGAEWKGKKAGSMGDVGCFSFYSIKNMTVGGDGGMITTSNEDIAELAKKLRDCGRETHYFFKHLGYTARLNTANAAIGREQLKLLDEWNHKRRTIRSLYEEGLKDVEGLKFVEETPGGSSVYHLVVIRVKKRDELSAFLKEKGIGTGVHYPIPVHLQPPYVSLFGLKEGSMRISENCAKEVLSLPTYPELKKDEIKYVCEGIREFWKEQGS